MRLNQGIYNQPGHIFDAQCADGDCGRQDCAKEQVGCRFRLSEMYFFLRDRLDSLCRGDGGKIVQLRDRMLGNPNNPNLSR